MGHQEAVQEVVVDLVVSKILFDMERDSMTRRLLTYTKEEHEEYTRKLDAFYEERRVKAEEIAKKHKKK